MTQTLTTDRQQFEEWWHEEYCHLEGSSEAAFVKHVAWEAMQKAREFLANREAQPVWIDAEVHEAIQDILQGRMSGAGRYVTLNRNQAPNGFKQRMPIYTAPPAPAVPTPVNFSENADADTCRKWAWEQVKELVSADGWTLGDSITYFGFFCWGWDMRRQYNEQRPSQLTGATAVPDALANDIDSDDHPLLWSHNNGWNACRAAMLTLPWRGGELPDNVREALTLALQAMEFMGDTLNNIDAVCTEDVEFVTPAFTAVRGLLAAAPEGGNG